MTPSRNLITSLLNFILLPPPKKPFAKSHKGMYRKQVLLSVVNLFFKKNYMKHLQLAPKYVYSEVTITNCNSIYPLISKNKVTDFLSENL